jgi:hypothetical protein
LRWNSSGGGRDADAMVRDIRAGPAGQRVPPA